LKNVTSTPTAPFAAVSANYWELNIPVLPIMPGTKRPGYLDSDRNRWEGLRRWQKFCSQLPTESEIDLWSQWPDAGICIPLGKASDLIALDLDTEQPDLKEALDKIIPPTPCIKKGMKGWTAFFRYNGEKSHRWKLARNTPPVIELLSRGCQTVIPPTIHPDTNEPYVWITPDSLLDIEVEDLPFLPEDFYAQVETVMNQYRKPEEKIEIKKTTEPTINEPAPPGLDPFQDVNHVALQHLDEWIPELIPTARREPNGHYRCVATWRGGDGPNVGITPQGIRDWARGNGLTPIDLVMAVNDSSAGPAMEWLKGRIITHLPEEEPLVWEDQKTSPNKYSNPLGLFTFGDLEDNPPPIPELFWRGALLFRGAKILVAGAPKIGKSNFFLALSIAAAKGDKFLGHKFSKPLKVLWLQAEIHKAFLKERIKRLTPLLQPAERKLLRPNLIMSGRLRKNFMNNAHMDEIFQSVKHFKPDLIGIDPIINFSLEDENNNAAISILLEDRVTALMQASDCAVIVLHHTKKDVNPKDPFQSIRGASAFRGWYDSGILLSGDPKSVIINYETRNCESPAAHGSQLNPETGLWEEAFEAEEMDVNEDKTATKQTKAPHPKDEERLNAAIELLRGFPDGLQSGEFMDKLVTVLKMSERTARRMQVKMANHDKIKVIHQKRNRIYQMAPII
jgi:hypothetical protein